MRALYPNLFPYYLGAFWYIVISITLRHSYLRGLNHGYSKIVHLYTRNLVIYRLIIVGYRTWLFT